jgi:hypothetical protein
MLVSHLPVDRLSELVGKRVVLRTNRQSCYPTELVGCTLRVVRVDTYGGRVYFQSHIGTYYALPSELAFPCSRRRHQ